MRRTDVVLTPAPPWASPLPRGARRAAPRRTSGRKVLPPIPALCAASLSLALATGCTRCSNGAPGEEFAAADIPSPFDPNRSPDPLAPPPERFPLGEWAQVEDYRMRALRVETCEVEPYFAPAPGSVKLGVLVEIEGRTQREVPVNVLYATLTDSGGETHRPTPAGCRPTLLAGRTAPGTVARGYVSFEVSEAARGLLLHYEPTIVGRAPQALHFDLGR